MTVEAGIWGGSGGAPEGAEESRLKLRIRYAK